jgi:O-antigen/teichoic acid export membrane protein
MGPWLLDVGLTYWLGRERARGVSRERLLGAALPIAFISSLIGVAAAIPLSHALGQGRSEVTTFIQIGLLLMPLYVILTTLSGLAVGESRWSLVIASRLTGSVVPTLAIASLWAVGELTVTTGAAAYLIGAIVGMLIFVGAVRGTGRLVFSLRRSIEATRFGVKSWLSTVAATANNRLDQVLMAGLVSSRELGLYAVAVTVTSVMHGLSGAVSNAQYPRVAAGDAGIAARTSRVTMTVVALGGGVLAAASPWLIPFVFGQPFADAVPMAVILLVAGVPMAGAVVLSSALSAANNPAAAMRAELVALAFTIPALILFLPDHGGLVAAGVSLIAYTIRLGMQLPPARRTFAMSYRTFLVPTRADLFWVRDRLVGGIAR